MTTPEARTLGRGGAAPDVSAMGLGCRRVMEFYGVTVSTQPVRTIHPAWDLGATLLGTADMYGPFTNDTLARDAIAGDCVVLGTRFGSIRDPDTYR